MAVPQLTLRDLAGTPADVARRLPEWLRGEPDEAARLTLEAAARELHGRGSTLWLFSGRAAGGEPAWALSVPAAAAESFRPKGPAQALARCLHAAVLAGAAPDAIRLEDWRGQTCLVAPGMGDEDVAALALAETQPPPDRAAVSPLPLEVVLGGPALSLAPEPAAGGEGLSALARELGVHPVRVALALVEHHQPVHLTRYPPELVTSLREWGCGGSPLPPPELPASLAIADDPCPRRRHARTVLQRMLRMGKVGPGYHTEFDHFYRGAAAHERRQALEIAEALLRAGLLGEKPSVGQRHIYLRREALREIHALIERGETEDPELEELWTAPAPGAAAAATPRPAPSR